jgi:RNA polymerase sigma-70 factor (ECF subfamily)
VLVLKVFEDLSSAEVAAIVGCTEGAVEQRLVRARAALRKMEGES